jgi:type IV pilus assembly protein PilY1
LPDTGTVFVGANDGMLHAFNTADDGVEQFAYIPSAALGRLRNLSQVAFDQSHEYFVDGDIAVSNRTQTAGRNYLVGALGRGGKGLYGLDVTDPAAFDGDDVLWEYFSPTDEDLGHMLGRPVIAQLQNGTWAVIIGNGYNSTSRRAVLYVFNLSTGDLIQKLDTEVAGDNGLATPGLVLDNAGRVTTAYAGDLRGNVWKFNLSGNSANSWSIANSGQPLFTAETSDGVAQPITAPITATMKTEAEYAGDPHVGRWFVHFGTGSDFQSSDPSNTALQSWYGLIDTGTPILRSELLQTPGLFNAGEVAGRPVRTFREIEPNAMQTRRGWVIDLRFNNVLGERMVTASRFYNLTNPTLLASSVIPVDDVCDPGGRGYLNAVNPFTGGRLASPLFDVDDNPATEDMLDGVYPGSIDLGVGKPGEAALVDPFLVGGGSDGEVGSVAIIRPAGSGFRGRISWREIVR